ncbi:hypothetical protein [Allokutzneria multivorans]|uniref:hypothetical protein n=1 Tax=Allokutzneria multivorans TaxID=1142134 RepID=UPI0031F176CD
MSPNERDLVLPAVADGVTRLWCKAFGGIDPDREGIESITGAEVIDDVVYATGKNGDVISLERRADGAEELVLWDLNPYTGLRQVKRFVVDNTPGSRDSVADVVRQLAHPHRTALQVRVLGARLSERRTCEACRRPTSLTNPRGVLVTDELGFATVQHLECPEPPKPPVSNREAGWCRQCSGWIEAGDGLWLTLERAISHDGVCPSVLNPGPPQRNSYGETCSRCFLAVAPGQGWMTLHRRHGWQVKHAECPYDNEIAAASTLMHYSAETRYGKPLGPRGTIARIEWWASKHPEWDTADVQGRTTSEIGRALGWVTVIRAGYERHEDEDTDRMVTTYHADVRPATAAEVAAEKRRRAAPAAPAVVEHEVEIQWPQEGYVDEYGTAHAWDAVVESDDEDDQDDQDAEPYTYKELVGNRAEAAGMSVEEYLGIDEPDEDDW